MKKLKQLSIRTCQFIKGEILMLWRWINNLCFVYLTSQSRVRVFEGYGHWYLAKKYADKRTALTKVNKICGGKRHYVLPIGDISLIVLNRTELNNLKSKGYLKMSLNIDKIFKNAYYISK
jgi:hypothetical protein